jgi:hypothetical protein
MAEQFRGVSLFGRIEGYRVVGSFIPVEEIVKNAPRSMLTIDVVRIGQYQQRNAVRRHDLFEQSVLPRRYF